MIDTNYMLSENKESKGKFQKFLRKENFFGWVRNYYTKGIHEDWGSHQIQGQPGYYKGLWMCCYGCVDMWYTGTLVSGLAGSP